MPNSLDSRKLEAAVFCGPLAKSGVRVWGVCRALRDFSQRSPVLSQLTIFRGRSVEPTGFSEGITPLKAHEPGSRRERSRRFYAKPI